MHDSSAFLMSHEGMGYRVGSVVRPKVGVKVFMAQGWDILWLGFGHGIGRGLFQTQE